LKENKTKRQEQLETITVDEKEDDYNNDSNNNKPNSFDDSIMYTPTYPPTPTENRKSKCGRLIVKVVGAMGLKKTIDGYCIVQIKTREIRTRIIKNSLTPQWNEILIFNNYKPKKEKTRYC